MTLSDDIIQEVWNKGRKIEGLDENKFRLDACGALIMRDKYEMTNQYGWKVDHIIPRSKGGDDALINLRPLHYLNDMSKADDYPSYTAMISFDGTNNVKSTRNLSVNIKLREKLDKYYNK